MIEFLFWEGCPSHERVLARLTDQLREIGLDPAEVKIIEIETVEDAEAHKFVGSPTIRLDGTDIADPKDEPYGLECRLYYHRDGRPSPLPDPDDMKEALTRYASKSK